MLIQTVLLVILVLIEGRQNYHVIYQWSAIEPEWNQETREKSLINGSYVPENNVVTGIKLWKDQLYLSVPRMKNGVPVTLAVVPATPEQTLVKTQHGLQNLNIVSPKLKPFPSWEMQTRGDCKAFQFVQSMEIDPTGRMWVIDNGRTAIMTDKPNNTCPPRLVILDLESGGTILKNYVFPKEVTDYETVLLNDIVLDHEHGGFAYISDNGSKDPGLIVYSLATNTSWKVRHGSMKAEDDAGKFLTNKVQINGSIDGIALSPSGIYDRMVYYSPLASFRIFSIPTAVLKSGLTNVNDFVREVAKKESQSGGMVMTSAGTLFLGLLANNSVAYLNTSPENFGQLGGQDSSLKILAKDDNLFQWIDTFAIDEEGYLWCVTNNWQNFVANKNDPEQTNYRVIKFMNRSRNYQYFDDGSAPILSISHLDETRSVYGIPVSISLDGTFPLFGGSF